MLWKILLSTEGFCFVSCSNSNTATESSESRAQENNENPVIKNDEVKKVSPHRCQTLLRPGASCSVLWRFSFSASQQEASQNVTPVSGTEASPVKRRGRPPKAAAASAEKESAAAPTGGAGRGRKRAADSNPSEAVSIKTSKQQQQNDEGTKRQIDLQR